ncbi:MAG: transcriptional regulator NrdR [Nitrospinota bacterium]
MKCPSCGSTGTKVIDSRLTKDGNAIRRRRECETCSRRFTTYERLEEVFPLLVKKDGRREPYDRNKVLTGIQKALEKRPVSAEAQEAMVDRVGRYILELGEKEIPSRVIGERVMSELREVDHVAYVRFASVYRSFKDLDDFMEQLKELLEERVQASGDGSGNRGAAQSEDTIASP